MYWQCYVICYFFIIKFPFRSDCPLFHRFLRISNERRDLFESVCTTDDSQSSLSSVWLMIWMPTKSGLQLNGYMPMCMGPGYQDARDQHGLRMYLRKK